MGNMNELEWEVLLATRDKLAAAPHGHKGKVIAQACHQLQCDEQTVYRKLAAAGLETGRKQRKDKGEVAYTLAHLQLIGGMLAASTRANGKQLLTLDDAVEIAYASGKLPCKLSGAWVSQLLRDASLHPDQVSHQTPATQLRTLHPNHLWQIDASVCVLYYIKGNRLQSMPADEFYKNKPHNLAKVVNDLCIRFAATDHYSATIWARYYTGGETAENLVEFFFWCISQRADAPAHGVPFMVMLDPGSANKSHIFKNLCKRLNIKLIINEVGNPRAKGQVENSHNLIERHFEGRLPFLPAVDLASLNTLCERWQVAYNASARHTRHGQPRYSAWMHITPEQLRIAPPMDLLRELVTTVEETRRVSNNMTVSFAVKGWGKKDYKVAYVPGVLVGQTVTVVVNPYRAPAIDVQYVDAATGEIRWMCVEPIEVDRAGFNVDAPVVDQDYKALPYTTADHARNEALKAAHNVSTLEEATKAKRAHAQAYTGTIDAMADVDATPVPAYLPRRGTALDAEKRAVAALRLSVVDACKRIKLIAGAAYDPQTYAWLEQRFGSEGVPEDQIDALAAQYGAVQAEQPIDEARPAGLRVVGRVGGVAQ